MSEVYRLTLASACGSLPVETSIMRNTIALTALLSLAACQEKGFVVYNNPPTVTIIEPLEGAIYQAGDPVTFLGQAADETDVQDLNVEWASSIDQILPDGDPPDGDGVVEYVSSILSTGTHVITLRATDFGNEQGEATVQIQIEDAPDVPNLTITAPAQGVSPPIIGVEGVPFNFAVLVSDADTPADQLVVELTEASQGLLCYMVPGVSGNATCSYALPIGQYLLAFKVTDTDGFESTRNATFEVRDAGDVDQDGDGHTPNGGDCNDSAVTVFPGAPEVCDGLDNDCNPATQVDANTPCFDDDGDGFCEGPPCTNASNTQPDCDDTSPLAFPGNTEICDGLDNDCVNGVDNGFNSVPYYIDFDADSFGDENDTAQYACEPILGKVTNNYDCNDLDNTINPNAVENETNGIDDDCDGLLDEGGANFDDDFDGYCEAPPCTNAPGLEQDCDDTNGQVNPGAPEVCGDGIDNNCDFDDNDENALGCTPFYLDADGDGYGTAAGVSCRCDASSYPYTSSTSNDCNDGSAIVNPGQTQFFNTETNGSFDYNCDGNVEKFSTQTGTACLVDLNDPVCGGTDGWIGSVPDCGDNGQHTDNCGFDLGLGTVLCGIFCAADCSFGLAECANCIITEPVCDSSAVCDADEGPTTQTCR